MINNEIIEYMCDECGRRFIDTMFCPECGKKGRISQIKTTKETNEDNHNPRGIIFS